MLNEVTQRRKSNVKQQDFILWLKVRSLYIQMLTMGKAAEQTGADETTVMFD